jgi:hypothetical protein
MDCEGAAATNAYHSPIAGPLSATGDDEKLYDKH